MSVKHPTNEYFSICPIEPAVVLVDFLAAFAAHGRAIFCVFVKIPFSLSGIK